MSTTFKQFRAPAGFCRYPEPDPVLPIKHYDTFNVRDGRGYIVEAWRAVRVSGNEGKPQHIKFEIDGYRDTSDL